MKRDFRTIEWEEVIPTLATGMSVNLEVGPGCNDEFVNSISFVNEGLHSKVVIGKHHVGHTIRPGEERSYGLHKDTYLKGIFQVSFEFEDQRQYNADGSRSGTEPVAADAVHKVTVCKMRPE